VRPADVLHGLRIDDLEVEAELLLHLVLPFQAWTGRADDDRRAGAVTKEELLHDQPGLDRLAKVASIDDLDVLREGAVVKVWPRVKAPSTVGTFLRAFTFGHVRQLGAVAAALFAHPVHDR